MLMHLPVENKLETKLTIARPRSCIVCMEYAVAPRAYWKGYLKLSLVSCPVALFPASSEREKISFNQINKKTGNRIRYRKVDAETEEGALAKWG
jgi:hypothetical protein